MSGRTLQKSDSLLLEGTVPLTETVLYVFERGGEVSCHVPAPEQGQVFRKQPASVLERAASPGCPSVTCSWTTKDHFKCSFISKTCTNEVLRARAASKPESQPLGA